MCRGLKLRSVQLRPMAPCHRATVGLASLLHEHRGLKSIKPVGLVRPLPSQVEAPADARRLVRQGAVWDQIIEKEHSAPRHGAGDYICAHIDPECGFELLRGRLDVPGVADAARMGGRAAAPVPTTHHLHASISGVRVDQGNPCGQLEN